MLHKGDVLKDRYLILQRIGSGDHGTVFRARDKPKDRDVAVRVLLPEFAADADYVRHFHREAKSAARLDSSHIVKVLDTDHVQLRNEHVHFQVMEYVDGPTLQQVLDQRGRFSIVQALAIAIQIARALGEAQKRGILHLDIRPKNIFIGEGESVKVGDFGIARAMEVSTSPYMAPERCRAGQEQVDVRSDIYSLGVVLHALLLGRTPREPAPSSAESAPPLPVRVQKLIERCLQDDPRDRFQNPRDLRLALEKLAKATQSDRTEAEKPPPAVARVPRRRPPVERVALRSRSPSHRAPVRKERGGRRGRLLRAAAVTGTLAVLVVALGVGLVYVRDRQDESPPPPPPPPTGTSIDLAASLVAYVGDDGNLYVVSEDEEEPKKLTNDGGIAHPSWSPDGQKIAFVHMEDDGTLQGPVTELVVVRSDGSEPETVAEAGVYESGGRQRRTILRNPRWSPDGSAIYYLEDRGEQETRLNRLILGSDTGQPAVEEVLLDPAVLFGEGAFLESFDLHPGDGTIVYEGCRVESPEGCGLGIQSPPGADARTAVLVPIHDGYFYSLPAWSLDGKEVGLYAYTVGAPRIMTIDAAGGDLRDYTYTASKPNGVENRFWPTLAALPGGGFAYEGGDEIRLSGWGDIPSGITVTGRFPAVFPGSGYRREATSWAGIEQLDCGDLWKGEYFANEKLEGTPSMVRCDRNIDFDWQDGSGPWPSMPADHFSARWTGHIYVADSGNYTLKSFTDDGVRLWFDQQKVIDEWRPQHDEHKVDIPAEAGAHAIQMEFYEGRGEAIAQFSWTKVEPTPTPTPPPTPSPTPSATPRKPTPGPTPSPVPLPDLAISRLRWEPATLHEGDAITRWCVTVENLGGDYTPAATYIDIAVDGRDMLGVTEWQIGRLKAGGSREICKSGDPSELGTGSHTAVATIDRGDHVDEIDEENNTFTKGLVVGPPR